MGRCTVSRSVGRIALLACVSGIAGAQRGSVPQNASLKRVERRVVAERVRADGAVSLRSAQGERIGTWQLTAEDARLRLAGQPEIVAPPLQMWVGSPDGRTLAGAGDPRAPEHPFELTVVVLRDGLRVAELAEKLGPESELTVAADGHVAVAGHPAGQRGQPFALVLRPDGQVLFRHALPEGTLARDPVLFGERLYVRVHGLQDAGVSGDVVRVDEHGVHVVLAGEGVLALVGFPEAERALALTRTGLVCLDALDGRVLWRSAERLRPANPHAWTLWRFQDGERIAVVTASVQRADASASAPQLVLLDAADGAELGTIELDAACPLSEVDVTGRAARVVVDWNGTEEVFTWQR